NPAPVISSLSPSSATAGDPAFTLTVNGTGFIAGSAVAFNGTARATTFVSATQVTASIPASDIATAGTYNVTVTNAAPGGGTSATATFTVNPVPVVNNPVPAISSLSPSSVTAGAAPQTLTVNGSNFLASSVVNFNGSARTTTFVSASQLTIGLTAADQATAGTYNVTVTNPAPGGGTSAPATFTVNPAPVACTAPTNLSASAVTSTSATVRFTGSGSATGYTVTTSPATTTQTLPASATSVSLTGLAPSTAYSVSIVSNCAGGAASAPATTTFTTTAAPLTDLVVNSAQTISGTYNNVTVTSTGVATLGGTLTVNGTLTVQTGGALLQACQVINGPGSFVLQAGASLVICDAAGIAATGAVGAVQVTGTRTFSPDANYGYNGTAAQVTGSGLPGRVLSLVVSNAANVTLSQALSVSQVLRLEAGNLATNGQGLTLLSTATGTALVDNRGGAVVGTAAVQRYITPTNAGLGYRHYASPVLSTTVADLAVPGVFTPVVNPAYNTLGNTVTPFPNVFGYNEARVNTSGSGGSIDFDKGFFSPTATSDVLEPTRGYTVNIAAQATVDFVGTLNNGSLTAGALTRGSQTESGWHLRGNPYPAPLDWSSVISNGRAVNIENALYVYKSDGQYSGSYTSFVNGQATNSGTNVLPVAQGFFVRTAAGQTGSITFANADRLTTPNATPFQRSTADTRPQLTLALSSASARTQAVVYFEQGATPAFDNAFDARALPAPNGLTLGTETAAAEALSINGQPVLNGADALLPLRVAALAAGTYTLAVDKLENLPANYRAYLRDGLTGTYTDLATTPAITLNLSANGTAGGRYAVLFTTQARGLATAPVALAQLASVYPNPARGTATLLVPTALRGNQATAVTVVDNVGRVVLSRTLAAGASETLELPLSTLTSGVYTVLARTASGLVAKRLVVE
ncbi:beta strand repeat-containing protein, partial [Hymenobacter glacialis]|uniref:beta strand repeat-containing protein n=1 Tax=Hymenobacter glacialis TaxID=1908236 RepID=UPI000AEC8527